MTHTSIWLISYIQVSLPTRGIISIGHYNLFKDDINIRNTPKYSQGMGMYMHSNSKIIRLIANVVVSSVWWYLPVSPVWWYLLVSLLDCCCISWWYDEEQCRGNIMLYYILDYWVNSYSQLIIQMLLELSIIHVQSLQVMIHCRGQSSRF